MTSRPRIPPSSGRPRLPISMDEEWRDGRRALPSPTAPTSSHRSPQNHHRHHYQYPDHHHHYNFHSSRYRALPPPSFGLGEDRYTGRTRDSDDMIPATPMETASDQAHSFATDQHPSFWSHHNSFIVNRSPTGLDERPPIHPRRSLSTSTGAPRLPNGLKKQQSGRKRTACDRCKALKSSVSTSLCVASLDEDVS